MVEKTASESESTSTVTVTVTVFLPGMKPHCARPLESPAITPGHEHAAELQCDLPALKSSEHQLAGTFATTGRRGKMVPLRLPPGLI
jgi:hypothetical protein